VRALKSIKDRKAFGAGLPYSKFDKSLSPLISIKKKGKKMKKKKKDKFIEILLSEKLISMILL